STVYTYEGTQIKVKETFVDLGGGIYMGGAKEVYTYDGNGNVKTVTDSIPDGAGGYDLASTTTYTYDLHKGMVTLGEESFIVIGAANVSRNNFTKQEVVDATG